MNNSDALWGSGQPDDYGDQDCAYLAYGYDYLMGDYSCYETIGAICQIAPDRFLP